MAADLSPVEVQQFSSGRRSAALQNAQSKKRTALTNEGLALQGRQQNENYALTLQDMYAQQKSGRSKLPGQYVNRGLLNSGIYKQGLQDFYDAAHRGQNQARTSYEHGQQGLAQQMKQSALNQQEADEAYMLAMADLNEQEAARRAELASDLRGAM